MALYPNGLIPTAALDPVPAANSQTAWLLPGPAASLLRVQAECRRLHGWTPLVTSAGDGFRSLNRQEAVFRQRYRTTYARVWQSGRYVVDRRVWKGVPYWRYQGAAAAIPGTSNHGLGITVDISGLGGYGTARFNDLAPLMVAEGWSNAEGRRVAEPWHWNYTRSAYPVTNTNLLPGVSITVPGGALPDLLAPEDDMFSDDDRAQAARTEEHAMAARQHASNAEQNSYQALRLIEEHLFPAREHGAAAEANAYKAVRLLEQTRRDLAAAADGV